MNNTTHHKDAQAQSSTKADAPEPKKRRKSSSLSLIGRLVRDFMHPHLPMIGLAVLFMAMAALMTGALARLMEPIIDDVFAAEDKSALVPVAVMVFAAFVVRGLATYGHTVLMNRIGQSIVADIQRRTFDRLLGLDLAYFMEHSAGELIARLISDVQVMRTAVAESLTSVFKSSLTLMVLVGVMLYQDWKLASAAFVVFPLAAWSVGRIGKRLRKLSGKTQTELAELSSMLNESFRGIRPIKALCLEDREKDRIGGGIERVFRLSFRAVQVGAMSTPINEILSGVAIVTLILYGGSQVVAGESTAGAFFSFITAFIMAYEPIKRLSKLNNILQMGLGAAERVLDVLDSKAQIADLPGAVPLVLVSPDRAQSARGAAGAEIRFEKVGFNYPDGTTALADIDLVVPEGKTVALVGPSGAGKSSVLNLIPRFFDVASGRVLVAGQDVREVTLDSLRSAIAMVNQDIMIFDDTVAANIGLGRLDASRAEIEQAAKAAKAHDFITAFPEGYDTRLGEAGVRLSGGQKQRIAIARALLRDAPILLLDEATSALDSTAEKAVQSALSGLRAGRTTLVVAHRLSTVRDADLIYVMEQGQIVETGTHDDLIRKGGLYAQLYGLQDLGASDSAAEGLVAGG